MKFCPVVPEICGGQVHGARKERIIIIIIIIIRNGAKTISLIIKVNISLYTLFDFTVSLKNAFFENPTAH
jgi:hypothetical protein